MGNKRNNVIDIIRGGAIVLMVAGHTYNHFYHNFIYLFHVAVFYIISGYCFNDSYTDSLKSLFILLKKRIKGLWLPYFSYNLCFLLLRNLLIKLGLLTLDTSYFNYKPILNDGFTQVLNFSGYLKTILKSIFFIHSQPLAGGLWFLGGLFYVTFFYAFIHWFLKKLHIEKFHILFSIVLLFLGFYIKKFDLLKGLGLGKQICLVFVTETLFTLGTLISKFSFKYDLVNFIKKNFNKKCFFFIFCIAFVALYEISKFETISIAAVSIINPFAFICFSLLGFVFLYSFGKLIDGTKSEKLFVWLGKNTIPILALHTVAFKFVNFLQMICYGESKVVLALYPVWKTSLFWGLLYTFVGVLFPSLLILALGKIKFFKIFFKF